MEGIVCPCKIQYHIYEKSVQKLHIPWKLEKNLAELEISSTLCQERKQDRNIDSLRHLGLIIKKKVKKMF